MRRDYADGSVLIGDEFWGALYEDMLAAKARVIIYSPFVGMWQLEQRFNKIFDQIMMRQIRICVILQVPYRKRDLIQTDEQFNRAKLEYDECVAWLQKKRIHVTFRPDIHEKLVVIDEHILWDGSKNVLAQGKSSERMNRFTNRQRVIDAVIDHKLADCTDCQKLFAELGFTSVRQQLIRTRKALGKSQRTLSTTSGVHQKNIGFIENGQTDPKLSTIERLLAFLGVHLIVVPGWLVPSIAHLLSNSNRDKQMTRTNSIEAVRISFAPPSRNILQVNEQSIVYSASANVDLQRQMDTHASVNISVSNGKIFSPGTNSKSSSLNP